MINTEGREGRDVIQGDLDRLEMRAHMNLIRDNKIKCKILHLGKGNSRYVYRLGKEHIESSSVEKKLEFLIDKKLDRSSLEGQLYSGLRQKRDGQQGESGDCSLQFCLCETPSELVHWDLGTARKSWSYWSRSRGGPEEKSFVLV